MIYNWIKLHLLNCITLGYLLRAYITCCRSGLGFTSYDYGYEIEPAMYLWRSHACAREFLSETFLYLSITSTTWPIYNSCKTRMIEVVGIILYWWNLKFLHAIRAKHKFFCIDQYPSIRYVHTYNARIKKISKIYLQTFVIIAY